MDVFERRLRGDYIDSDEDIEGSAGSMAMRLAEEDQLKLALEANAAVNNLQIDPNKEIERLRKK